MMPELNSAFFVRKEFECRCGCGQNSVDAKLLEVLDSVRAKFNKPVHINSANRCPKYNASIGGSSKSLHMSSRAADIYVENTDLMAVKDYLEILLEGWGGIGIYPNDRFIHVDTRSNGPARWVG